MAASPTRPVARSADADGTTISTADRRVRLKWHRLRRRAADPVFGCDVLAAGALAGATMEVDLRVTGDGRFVVLHEASLEDETDGAGPVTAFPREALAALRYRDGGRPLLMVEDLVAVLRGADVRTSLQLDMKDDLAVVGRAAAERLAETIADVAPLIVVSGDSSPLTEAIVRPLPRLACGLEPSFRLLALRRAGAGRDLADHLAAEIARAPRCDIVYLSWRLILAAEDEGLDLVAVCHRQGARVDAWTFTPAAPDHGLDDQEWQALDRLLALGVDQITTDEALALAGAVARRG